MNKTYRVMFNKARGSMMVVNELTKSVQKKGSKTVVAATALTIGLLTGAGVGAAPVTKTIGTDGSPTEVRFQNGASPQDTSAIYAQANSASMPETVTVLGSTIDIQSVDSATNKNKNAIQTNTGGVVNVGTDTTQSISISKALHGIYAEGAQSIVTFKANEIKFGTEQSPLGASGASAKDGASITLGTEATTKLDIYTKLTAVSASSKSNVELLGKAIQIKTLNAKTVTVNKGTASIGSKNTESITLIGNGVNATGLNGVLNIGEDGTGSVTIEGKTGIESTSSAVVNVKANSITVNAVDNGLIARPATINLGTASTKKIDITSQGKGIALWNVASKIALDGQTITVTSTSTNTTNAAIYNSKGTATIGSDSTQTLNINASSANGIFAKNSTTTLTTADQGTISVSSEGEYGVTSEGAKVNIGSETTKLVTLKGGDTAVKSHLANSGVTIKGSTIDVDASNFGLFAQSNTENITAPANAARLDVIGDTITVDAKEGGIVAFSNSQVNVQGNITVNSKNAIDARGNATVNVNTDKTKAKTTVLNGDIVFETPNVPGGDAHNSGKLINAYVNVGLHGANSKWTGRGYKEYTSDTTPEYSVEIETPPYFGDVTGFKVDISDGGSWAVTGDTFINTLNLQGQATVATNTGATVNTFNAEKINVTGLDNKIDVDAINARTLTVEAAGALTAKNVNATTLTGAGDLTVNELTFADTNNLSGFTGNATLNAGQYALTDQTTSRWLGGKVTLAGTAGLDVSSLANAEPTLSKVTVNGGALTATSGQIFQAALSDTTYVADPTAVGTKATLTSGTLTFVDGKYNVDYANKAGALLQNMQLVFTGSLMPSPTPETEPPLEQGGGNLTVEDLNTSTNPGNTIYDKPLDTETSTGPTANPHNLVIGSTGQVEAESSQAANNAQLIDKNVGVSQVKVSDQAELIAVNNNRTLTLIGDKQSENLVDTASTNLKLEVGGKETAGVLALGVNSSAVANKGTINVDTNIGEKGLVEVNVGSFEASKVVTNEGQLFVKDGANLTVTGTLDLKAGSTTTVEGNFETAANSTLNVATGSQLALNGTANIDTLTVLNTNNNKAALVTIGDKQNAGKVMINALSGAETKHVTFFLDPAWVEGGSNPMDQASSLVLNAANFDGKMVVGQNSYAVFGSEADGQNAISNFNKSSLTWGQSNVTALAYVAQPVNLGTDGRIIVDGSYAQLSDYQANPGAADVTVSVANKGVLMVKAQNNLITATNMKAVFDQGATLVVDGAAVTEQPYKFFGESATVTNNNAKILATNGFFDLQWVDNNGVQVTLNTQNNPYAGLMQGTDIAASAMNQPNTDAYQYADKLLSSQGTDRAAGAATFDAAMQTAGAAAVYTTAYDRAGEFRDAVRGEALEGEGNRLWAQVTGGKTKLKGIATGAQDLHVETDAYGLVVGGDTVIDGVTVGAAFTAGTGDSENKAVGVKDDFDFWGFGVYGKTTAGAFDILGDASITFLNSDLSMGGVADVKAKTDTTVYSVGVKAQKTFDVGVEVTPFAGLDLYHLRSDGYSNGHGAQVEDVDTTTVEIPIGVTVAKAFDTASGFTFKPVFDFAVVPTLGDRDVDSQVRFAGAQNTYNFTFADEVKVRTGLGFTAEKDNFSLGFNAGYDWGNEDRAATKLMLNAQYRF